jgi:LEA14-like dessication related protein
MSKKPTKNDKKLVLTTDKPLKKSTRRKSTSKKPKSRFPMLKKLLFVSSIIVIFLLTLLVYIILNSNKLIPMLSNFVTVSTEEVILKSETLTQKTARIEMKVRVENKAWFPIYLNDILFDLTLGEYNLAKNFQAKPNIKLLGRDKTLLPIGLNVESIATRRALQKTVEKNASELVKKILSQSPSNKNPYGDDIKVITKLTGKAELGINLLDYKLPFNKEF